MATVNEEIASRRRVLSVARATWRELLLGLWLRVAAPVNRRLR